MAAVAVFLTHASGVLLHTGRPTGALAWLAGVAAEGRSGVTFFFILSGFILTYNYRGRIGQRVGDRRRFWIARSARVLPLHWLCFLLAVPPFLFAHRAWPASALGATAVAHITLLQAWIPFGAQKYVTAFDGPSWSLSVEAFFYALFPLLLLAEARLRRRVRNLWPLIAVGVTAWIAVAIPAAVLPTGNQLFTWLFFYSPVVCLMYFVIGIICAVAFIETSGASRRVPEVAGVVLLAAALACHSLIPGYLRASALYVPVMVLVIWCAAHGDGTVSRRIAVPRGVRLGEASYAFYLTHNLVIMYVCGALFQAWPTVPTWAAAVALVVCFAITVWISGLLFDKIERPARGAIRARGEAWLGRRGHAIEPPAPPRRRPVGVPASPRAQSS